MASVLHNRAPRRRAATPRTHRRVSATTVDFDRCTSTSVLYSLNRSHLAAQPIILIAQLRSTLILHLHDHFDPWDIPPVYAALFGSASRNDMTPDSDLDLFVVRPDHIEADDSRWEEQIARVEAQATAWTGNDARVLSYGASEVEGSHEPVLREVRDDGLTLFGERSWLIRAVSGKKGKRGHQTLHR